MVRKEIQLRSTVFGWKDAPYEVVESHSPNMALQVFCGTKEECRVIVDAFVKIGYEEVKS